MREIELRIEFPGRSYHVLNPIKGAQVALPVSPRHDYSTTFSIPNGSRSQNSVICSYLSAIYLTIRKWVSMMHRLLVSSRCHRCCAGVPRLSYVRKSWPSASRVKHRYTLAFPCRPRSTPLFETRVFLAGLFLSPALANCGRSYSKTAAPGIGRGEIYRSSIHAVERQTLDTNDSDHQLTTTYRSGLSYLSGTQAFATRNRRPCHMAFAAAVSQVLAPVSGCPRSAWEAAVDDSLDPQCECERSSQASIPKPPSREPDVRFAVSCLFLCSQTSENCGSIGASLTGYVQF
ncbi:hypothetical protein B0T19DRAFT_421717 [Cercophora scortea]|uniref:Uncharacterized protein n=1 Tax=Cercophora scortea TaxID=314031 RepID=A0AAE0ILP0_9PEZI|nr:hypothetical protein B0T19DRAFT_421717 [Cercophora scortea]